MNLAQAADAETAIRKIFYGICERGVNALRVAPEGDGRFHVEITRWKPLTSAVKSEIRDAFKAGAGCKAAKGEIAYVAASRIFKR